MDQKGPADLNKILNANYPNTLPLNGSPAKSLDDKRDSAYFSSADASSKHASVASFAVGSVLSPAGSMYQFSIHDNTPSPVAPSAAPVHLPHISPSNMSVASMMSPTTHGASTDQRRLDRPSSVESGGDGLGPAYLGPESRRESVDSRIINQQFNGMRLGADSPFASRNHSTSSFHQAAIATGSPGAGTNHNNTNNNTLTTQRAPRQGLDSLSVHRISNGYQPNAERNPAADSSAHLKVVKTAPAITGPATGTIARAAEPTKGQAWAFPEEEIQKIGPAYNDSRRSSIAESYASSQFTTESRLPPGQRRLEDGEYDRLSAELPSVHHHHHHHHTLQSRQLDDLQLEDQAGVGPGQQPYSRTPELRVSHKLAERKRRTEMKELFDQLRDLMPQERGAKASKWEILTKAIAEYQRQSDHIRTLQNHYTSQASEIEMLRGEIHSLRAEGARLRSEISGPGHPHPSQPAGFGQTNYSHPSRPEQLPPIRSISGSIRHPGHPGPAVPESMTGVQYDPPRAHGSAFQQ